MGKGTIIGGKVFWVWLLVVSYEREIWITHLLNEALRIKIYIVNAFIYQIADRLFEVLSLE